LISEPARGVLSDLQARGIKLGLGKVRSMLRHLGSPQRHMRVVQIAGTNGKGSVSYGLEAIARSCGLRTGTFISPHLVSPAERVRVDGRSMEEDEFSQRVVSLSRRLRRWATADGALSQVTYFEFGLALALEAFRDHGVQLVILEVGMGGRLDATTAADPQLTCITSLSLDHQDFLGPDLPSIAGEKAGIARRGVPLLLGPVPPEAEARVRALAAAAGAPVIDVRPQDGVVNGMWGRHQLVNAAMALDLARQLGLPDGAGQRAALAQSRVPGRCERFEAVPANGDDPRWPEVILDGAHNQASAAALALALAAHPAQAATDMLISVGADKDARSMLDALVPAMRRVIVTTYAQGRGPMAAETLAQHVRALGAAPMVVDSAAAGLDLARQWAGPGDRLVVTGSLFLVGEVRARMRPGEIP
jgi:dihydrofolate synthase/folylpolyglutamate synthase